MSAKRLSGIRGLTVLGLFLAAVTALAWRFRRRFPFLLTGWWWYLGMLVPVIGLVQVGMQAHPDYLKARYMLANLLSMQGRYGESIPHYEEALRLDPDDAQTRNSFGAALAQEGRYEEALAAFAEALRLAPDYAEAHYNLGALLDHLGWREEARKHLEEANRLKPGLGS